MAERSEARTRKELIDPKLQSAGWWNHDWQVEPEYPITAGRIHFDGKSARRGNPLKADYLLRYRPARAIAVVVPEGILFQTNGAYQQVKSKLLKEANLHTVVSLPAGMFLPYSAVKTSVIFFDKGAKATKDVWFYEVPLLDGKKLTKKAGITEAHFAELRKLYKKRPETERSWLVPVEKIIKAEMNLSAGHYNPHGPEEEELLEPEQYAEEIKSLLASAMTNVDDLLRELGAKT